VALGYGKSIEKLSSMCAKIRMRKNAKRKEFFSSRINILFNINVDSSSRPHSCLIASPKTATSITCS